jgi:hypothetical protein
MITQAIVRKHYLDPDNPKDRKGAESYLSEIVQLSFRLEESTGDQRLAAVREFFSQDSRQEYARLVSEQALTQQGDARIPGQRSAGDGDYVEDQDEPDDEGLDEWDRPIGFEPPDPIRPRRLRRALRVHTHAQIATVLKDRGRSSR